MNKNKFTLSLFTSILLASSVHAKQNIGLEKMIVTAQKTEENVQEVPISLSVLDEFTIEDRDITSVNDIARQTPNFHLSNPGDFGVLNPSIRGLNTDPSTAATSVNMYINGVPHLTTLGFNAVLEDVERIEVLRGPQGTLYGKNAYGGVINIITKKPNNETKAKATVDIGSDSKKVLNFNASGAIVKDKFFVGIGARHYEKDGFIKNLTQGNMENDRENDFGKLHFRYLANENLEFNLISTKTEKDDGSVSQNLASATNPREIESDINGYIKSDTVTHALNIAYTKDKYKFESTTAYQKNRDYRLADFDYTTMLMQHSYVDAPYTTTSQEFKLNVTENNFNYLVGLYGDKQEKTGGYRMDSLFYPPAYIGQFNTNLDSKSYGIFTHANYNINNKFAVSAGIRYDKDKKSIDDLRYGLNLNDEFSAISPKIAFKYKQENSMTYFTIAKGYKSGGFYQFSPTGKQAFDKETLWNYELGTKTSLLDNKLHLNASIFYMDISDMQVLTAVNTTQGYISNAASATSKGIELDMNYTINNEFSIFSTLGYNSVKLDKFSDSKGDYARNYNPYAPKYNFNLGVQYRSEKGFFARAGINGYGDMYLDKANNFKKDAYNLVNAKLGYETENYGIYVYGNNIFDKNHDTVGYYDGMYTMLYPGREIGVKLTYRF